LKGAGTAYRSQLLAHEAHALKKAVSDLGVWGAMEQNRVYAEICIGGSTPDHFARRGRSKAILRLVRRLNVFGCNVQITRQAA
jgi:hypothetical protein